MECTYSKLDGINRNAINNTHGPPNLSSLCGLHMCPRKKGIVLLIPIKRLTFFFIPNMSFLQNHDSVI